MSRGLAGTGWVVVTTPISLAYRAAAEIFRTVRKGGLFWLAMGPIRAIRFLPFTLILGIYYWYCRIRSLARYPLYSEAVFYAAAEGAWTIRNLLIDLNRRCEASSGRGRKLEVVVAGNVEPGPLFAVASLFPNVSDFHAYLSAAQLTAERPYFVPDGDRRAGVGAAPDQPIELSGPAAEVAYEYFRAARAINLPGLAKRNVALHTLCALEPKRRILAINLPTKNGADHQQRAGRQELVERLKSLKGQYLFLFLGELDPAANVAFDDKNHMCRAASALGMDFVDCLWLARNADGYIGAFDAYGLMTIGTRVPAILFDQTTIFNANDGQGGSPFRGNESGQRLAIRPPTADEISDEVCAVLGEADNQAVRHVAEC